MCQISAIPCVPNHLGNFCNLATSVKWLYPRNKTVHFKGFLKSVQVTQGREKDRLIYVSKNQLNQVEYLIGQSIQGNHVLFNLEDVREVFIKGRSQNSIELTPDEAYSVEHHIERLMIQPTLAQKKAYLERLDKRTFAHVVKTYFCIIENNIFEVMEVHH